MFIFSLVKFFVMRYNGYMVFTSTAHVNFYKRAKEKLNNFFYGQIYPVLVALLTAFFYVADTPLLGLTCFALTATVIFFCFEDLTPLIPLPIFVVLIFRDFSVFNTVAPIISLTAPAVALISHFIIYPIKKVYFGKVFFPLLLVCVALFLSGLGSPYVSNYARGFITTLTIGPLMLFAYFLFVQYVRPPKDFKLHRFIFKVLAFLGVTVFIELCFHEYRIVYRLIDETSLGWGNINSGASLLLLSVPACWYLLFYSKTPLPSLIALIVNYSAVILSNSDGVAGITFSFIPIILLWILVKGELKQHKFKIFKIAIFAIVLLSVLFVMFAIVLDKAPTIISGFILKLSNDSARTKFYIEAVELFKKFPIFGVGQTYVSPNSHFELTSLETFNFHSVLFHVLATMGFVGILSYSAYYVARFRVMMEKDTPFNVFAFLSFTMIEMYAFIDCCEFVAIPIMITVTIFVASVEIANKKGNEQPLPLLLHHNHPTF